MRVEAVGGGSKRFERASRSPGRTPPRNPSCRLELSNLLRIVSPLEPPRVAPPFESLRDESPRTPLNPHRRRPTRTVSSIEALEPPPPRAASPGALQPAEDMHAQTYRHTDRQSGRQTRAHASDDEFSSRAAERIAKFGSRKVCRSPRSTARSARAVWLCTPKMWHDPQPELCVCIVAEWMCAYAC